MNSVDSLEIVQADSQFPMRIVATVDRSLSQIELSPFSAPSQALKLCPPTKALGRDPDESEAIICLTGHLPSQTTFKIRRISGFFIVNPKAERAIIRYLIVSLQTNQELPRSGNASAR